MRRWHLHSVVVALLVGFFTATGNDAVLLPTLPLAGPVTPYDIAIRVAAEHEKMDPLLLKAIIAVESEFNERCVSNVGATGLMQLLPQTARALKIKNLFDPVQNIYGGAHHFRYLLKEFHNNLPKSLAAYNAGERPVRRYHGIPPYPETIDYVRRVLKTYRSYRALSRI